MLRGYKMLCGLERCSGWAKEEEEKAHHLREESIKANTARRTWGQGENLWVIAKTKRRRGAWTIDQYNILFKAPSSSRSRLNEKIQTWMMKMKGPGPGTDLKSIPMSWWWISWQRSCYGTNLWFCMAGRYFSAVTVCTQSFDYVVGHPFLLRWNWFFLTTENQSKLIIVDIWIIFLFKRNIDIIEYPTLVKDLAFKRRRMNS